MIFKNKNTKLIYTIFVTSLTLFSVASCKTKIYTNYLVKGIKIEVASKYASNKAIERYISPYRAHINKDLDSVISFTNETLDKSMGEWQSNIGNLIADACMEFGNPVFKKQHNKQIDIVLLNSGGIRSIVPKGNITKRTAFEVMPFENSLTLVALKGEEIMEMVKYIIKDKKPHPMLGLKIFLDKENNVKKVFFENKAIENNRIYYVATSDYLANGGDNMSFFLKNEGTFDLNYKIRNVLLDYFYKYKTIEVSTDVRIIKD